MALPGLPGRDLGPPRQPLTGAAVLPESLSAWVDGHPELAALLVGVSVITFVGSLLALPWLVARLPADYFLHEHREHDYRRDRHPGVHLMLVVLKNGLGSLLVLGGVAMLVLPGQGLLTILVGLMFTDFPGKYQLEKRLAARPRVLRALNWMRGRAGRPPLRAPPPHA